MSPKPIRQKALFDKLGVPLRSVRWSWGGERSDRIVFLKVWKNGINRIPNEGNREFVRVTDRKRFEGKDRKRKHPGYYERLEHLARVKNGAKSYMIICVAKDVNKIPREVRSFNSDELYTSGKLIEYDGNYWLEIIGHVLVKDLLLQKPWPKKNIASLASFRWKRKFPSKVWGRRTHYFEISGIKSASK